MTHPTRHLLALSLAALGGLTAAEPRALEPLAGTGEAGYSGESIPATSAQLREPGGMALGRNGTVFFCDTGNHAIRQIDQRGIISTVAGTGQAGFAGDGGPAAKAQLHSPARLSLDSFDNLWIADTLNHCLRRISGGKIRSLVGRHGAGFAGDGGPAEQAKLNEPAAVAFDASGNCFIADTKNHRIRRVDRQTGIITTLAGTGTAATAPDGTPLASAALNLPRDLAVDSIGRIWVATADGLVRLDPTPGVLRRPAATAAFQPGALTFSADGHLLFADQRDGSVRTLPATPAEAPWQTLLPVGTLHSPQGLAWDGKSGTLFAADSAQHRLQRLPAASARTE